MHQKRNEQATRKRRKRKLSAKIKLFLVFCLVVGLFVSALFICQTSTISVVGNDLYTKQEIISASEIEKGDNLMFIFSENSETKIYSKMPYIEEVAVKKIFPNQIKIELIESKDNIVVVSQNQDISVSKKMKVLSVKENIETEGVVVYGLNPENAVAGEPLTTKDPEKVKYLIDIFEILSNNNALDEFTEIDITDKLNITIRYQDRINVFLGTAGELEYKILLALETLTNNIETEITGNLDASISGRAFFSETFYTQPEPVVPPTTETQPQEGEQPQQETEQPENSDISDTELE